MDVVVQSFGEFKSSQMANAAHAYQTLKRFVLAERPKAYEGPDANLRVYRTLHLLQAAAFRLDSRTDFGSYWTNRALDIAASRSNPDCDLFIGYSGSCLKSLHNARSSGAHTVVYRGAPHGQFFPQEVDELLRQTGFEGVSRDTSRLASREHEEFVTADTVWVPSKFTADSLVSYGVDREKIELFPYGVDLGLFEPQQDRSTEPLDILYVGGITPEKGVHVLVDAVGQLDGEVQATLVGKLDPRLKDMIDEAERVEAIGWVDRDDLAAYYRNASVLVFPSFVDGFPSVVLEALACGCPVIATHNVGTRDLIDEYDAGVLVEPGSTDALVEAIGSIRSDARIQQMSENAISAIRDGEFDIERRSVAMGAFMESIVS